jgi:GNAT superfamily N-acetyltransferase
MLIRLAKFQDASAIARVHVETWQETYRGQMPDSVLDGLNATNSTATWIKHLKAGEDMTLVAELENELIGFCSLVPSRDVESDKTFIGEIAAIYILPRYWRHGAGKRLCERAVDEARKRGYLNLTLWVLETNHAARQFYEAMGFAWDGARKTIPMAGGDLPEMRYRRQLRDGSW